jgi:hypothetical protein
MNRKSDSKSHLRSTTSTTYIQAILRKEELRTLCASSPGPGVCLGLVQKASLASPVQNRTGVLVYKSHRLGHHKEGRAAGNGDCDEDEASMYWDSTTSQKVCQDLSTRAIQVVTIAPCLHEWEI